MQTRSRAYADFISFDLRKKNTYAKHVEIVCAPKMGNMWKVCRKEKKIHLRLMGLFLQE